MTPQPFLIILGVAFFPVTITLATLWLAARRRARTAEAIVHELAVVPALRGEPAAAATAQFGQALDAIALEVERIAEGQRFATRLLSERRDPAAREPMPRSVTPH